MIIAAGPPVRSMVAVELLPIRETSEEGKETVAATGRELTRLRNASRVPRAAS